MPPTAQPPEPAGASPESLLPHFGITGAALDEAGASKGKAAKNGLALGWLLYGLVVAMVCTSLSLIWKAVTPKKRLAAIRAQLAKGGNKRVVAYFRLAWPVILPPALFVGVPVVLHLGWAICWQPYPM